MPRPPREDYPGAWHHLMNRGAGHQDIFVDDLARQTFCECLALACQRSDLRIHAYCLMRNHFHVLVESHTGRLSAGLQYLTGRYTRLHNRRTGSDGPLFRGRSLTIGVDRDAHIIQASCYIHLNPVKAGLVASPDEWAWSSASPYLGATPAPNWLETGRILEMVAGKQPRETYRQLLSRGSPAGVAEFYARHNFH